MTPERGAGVTNDVESLEDGVTFLPVGVLVFNGLALWVLFYVEGWSFSPIAGLAVICGAVIGVLLLPHTWYPRIVQAGAIASVVMAGLVLWLSLRAAGLASPLITTIIPLASAVILMLLLSPRWTKLAKWLVQTEYIFVSVWVITAFPQLGAWFFLVLILTIAIVVIASRTWKRKDV